MSLVSAALLATTLAASTPDSSALRFSPYDDFSSLTAAQLAGTQVRFTYVWPERGRGFATLAFTTHGSTVDLTPFIPYYRLRDGFLYDDDVGAKSRFSVSASELEAMLDSIGTLPGVTDGGADSLGYVSFGLYAVADGRPRCFESIVDQRSGAPMFTRALGALAENRDATQVMTRWACAMGMLLVGPLQIVDDRVKVSISPFVREGESDGYRASVRVVNTSDEPLSPPLAVVLDAQQAQAVELDSPYGHTCAIEPGGAPYVRFPLDRPLKPGRSVEVEIRIRNPNEVAEPIGRIRVFVDTAR